jgi:hypothetical protein
MSDEGGCRMKNEPMITEDNSSALRIEQECALSDAYLWNDEPAKWKGST